MAANPIDNVQRHNAHAAHDIKPKLNDDNWISWKRALLCAARDQGLFRNIIGDDAKPTAEKVEQARALGPLDQAATPFQDLLRLWTERNDMAYHLILSTIPTELQYLLDNTDEAAAAWTILCQKFEPTDPNKAFIVRMKYNNYHMVDGQTVSDYISNLERMRNQLKKMGDPVSDISHGATILSNLPESWQHVAMVISLITDDPETIKTKLEIHEASLALRITGRPATAFIPKKSSSHTRGATRAVSNNWNQNSNRAVQPAHQQKFNNTYQNVSDNPNTTRTPYPKNCENCGKQGHSARRCWAHGGGMAGQGPSQRRSNNNTASSNSNTPDSQQRAITRASDQQNRIDQAIKNYIANLAQNSSEFKAVAMFANVRDINVEDEWDTGSCRLVKTSSKAADDSPDRAQCRVTVNNHRVHAVTFDAAPRNIDHMASILST